MKEHQDPDPEIDRMHEKWLEVSAGLNELANLLESGPFPDGEVLQQLSSGSLQAARSLNGGAAALEFAFQGSAGPGSVLVLGVRFQAELERAFGNSDGEAVNRLTLKLCHSGLSSEDLGLVLKRLWLECGLPCAVRSDDTFTAAHFWRVVAFAHDRGFIEYEHMMGLFRRDATGAVAGAGQGRVRVYLEGQLRAWIRDTEKFDAREIPECLTGRMMEHGFR